MSKLPFTNLIIYLLIDTVFGICHLMCERNKFKLGSLSQRRICLGFRYPDNNEYVILGLENIDYLIGTTIYALIKLGGSFGGII